MEIIPINKHSSDLDFEQNDNTSKDVSHGPKRWNPYVDNGGTVIGLAGSHYVILAADTRLSIYYSIYKRYISKISKLTETCVIGTSGMNSDINAVHLLLKKKINLFVLEHGHYPEVHVIARMLCIILYSRRFFPYYTFNILAGLDKHGKGVLYNYDAIGSYSSLTHSCVGTGTAIILPILDNRIEQKNQLIKNFNFNKIDDINFIKDAITSATERDIYTGDHAEIFSIDSCGIDVSVLDLKKD